MEPFIEYLPEGSHAEAIAKEAIKQRAHKLGLDTKKTTESQLIARETRG